MKFKLNKKIKNKLYIIAIFLSISASILIIGGHFGLFNITPIDKNDIIVTSTLTDLGTSDYFHINWYAYRGTYSSGDFSGTQSIDIELTNPGEVQLPYHDLTKDFYFKGEFPQFSYDLYSNNINLNLNSYKSDIKCKFNIGSLVWYNTNQGAGASCHEINGCFCHADDNTSWNGMKPAHCDDGSYLDYDTSLDCNLEVNVTCPDIYGTCQIRNLNAGEFYVNVLKNGNFCESGLNLCSDGICKSNCTPPICPLNQTQCSDGSCKDDCKNIDSKNNFYIYLYIIFAILFVVGLTYLYLKTRKKR